MDEQTFQVVNTEYIDIAGLFATEEFDKVGYISYLNNRVNSVALWIKLQRQYIDNFDIAYLPGLTFFKKFGYVLYWNNNEQFIKELLRIEKKEFKFISQLENAIKELIDFRAKKNANEKTVKQTRGSWIKTINSLGKLGYKIDKDKTSVEEFAYMIKAETENKQ
jgi:uncharacterized protein YqgQ